jgi:hypothetical protein
MFVPFRRELDVNDQQQDNSDQDGKGDSDHVFLLPNLLSRFCDDAGIAFPFAGSGMVLPIDGKVFRLSSAHGS